ncbi:4'-phosphopantetheinyl transferase superfamily protein [Streptomyces sp. NBC_01221]|uniref:4'-phosphopantetheinyl transferase family protein n=1 Tax=Streptomyces sp. NBC_01221 TaxID=2903782 RepID=UPI002251D5A8|nr:4'-phosphopantetheinyl transferase superfamily protein [Streptomyces sp. NBC_01221]MCX4791445.1 4'-phosphopantetheinyl transferase superfamily protein [Streptomyces sp. NBC_01221]
MLADILPPKVAVRELGEDPPGVPHHPQETVHVASALPQRRAEFITGRHCAREALRVLGVEPVPIPKGERGAPVWPTGVTGSITHCAGYRAAAVAFRGDVPALGVDAEPNEPLPDGVLRTIGLPSEHAMLSALPAHRGIAWDRLLFSAKESVYKAWFPLTGEWLDFLEAELTIDAEALGFSARLLVPGPVVDGVRWSTLRGRFTVRDGILLTAVADGHG